MSILHHLEQKYGFCYPALYHRLYDDGMLTWGEYDERKADLRRFMPPALTARSEAQNRENPPFLWVAKDFSLLEPAWLERWFEAEREDPEDAMLMGLSTFKLVSFGYEGTGNGYAFWFGGQEGEDVPIVSINYVDGGVVEMLAKNLQDFMFAQLLGGRLHDEHPRQEALNALRTHTPYLTPGQAEIIKEVFNRKEREIYDDVFYKRTVMGVLTEAEYEEIITRENAFARSEETFYLTEEEEEEEPDEEAMQSLLEVMREIESMKNSFAEKKK
jgi:hypothetical protein